MTSIKTSDHQHFNRSLASIKTGNVLKRIAAFAMLLLQAGFVRAQTMPSVIDSIHTGYMGIVRIHPGYIAALRGGALDIRQATTNSLGTFSNSVIVSDIQNIGGYIETRGDIVYTIGSKLTPINISTPTAPVIGTPVPLPGLVLGTYIWNDLLIVSAASRTYIYSISTPASPVLLDSLAIAITEMASKGNKLYARKSYGDHAYSWQLSGTAPFLTMHDSVNLRAMPVSISIVNNQLLAKNTDTLYRFDLNAATDFALLAAEKLPLYPTNGRLAALDTNHIGYCKYNSFWSSYGVTGNSFTDSFSLGYGDYYLGSGRLDNSIFYGDMASTRLIGLGRATSVQEHPGQAEITLYPNPVKDILHIQVPMAGIYNYELMNFQGSVMDAGRFKAQTGHIDLGRLPSGSYLLQLQPEHGGKVSKKIVKQ